MRVRLGRRHRPTSGAGCGQGRVRPRLPCACGDLTQNEAGEWLIGYRFSMGQASKTPKEVLGGTSGALVVDAYTGYNAVTLPQGRVRVGCWAHCRRRFFDALATAPEALDFILELYPMDAQAREVDVVRTAAHRELRQLRSAPILAQLHT
ncbi:transposase [Myxococcus xanthus]|nr:transposase [Myxococcus xanthus]